MGAILKILGVIETTLVMRNLHVNKLAMNPNIKNYGFLKIME
jgi:hypothetical protein